MVRVPKPSNAAYEARRCKILAHLTEPDCDVSIWQDSAHAMKVHPWALVQGPVFDIKALRHPARNNVVDEAIEIVNRRLAPSREIDQQVHDFPGSS